MLKILYTVARERRPFVREHVPTGQPLATEQPLPPTADLAAAPTAVRPAGARRRRG